MLKGLKGCLIVLKVNTLLMQLNKLSNVNLAYSKLKLNTF